jgi:ABC-type lipoprotein release transport system permease subunit
MTGNGAPNGKLGALLGALLAVALAVFLLVYLAGYFDLSDSDALTQLRIQETAAASRVLGHLLFGVSASDPLTLASVTIVLAAVAALAAYVPARRAMSVDP